MKTVLTIFLGLWMAMLPQNAIGQRYNNKAMAGAVIRPSGGNVHEIINRMVATRGGLSTWKRTRDISFSETYHSKDTRGKFIQRGQIDKHIRRRGNLFYSRSDDQSDGTPAFIRTLGPEGIWLQRSAIPINDKLMEKAYLFEASRDYLLLFAPYLIKKRSTQKVYQGIKPVHGTRCYQIYIPEIKDLKAFEGYEFLVSVNINTYCIKTISFWKEKKSEAKTTVFLSGYKSYIGRSHKFTHILPTHYFVIFPDSTTLSVNYTKINFSGSEKTDMFTLQDNLNATFPHNKARERDFSSREALVRYYPRSTFLVSPEQRHYYLDKRSNVLTR